MSGSSFGKLFKITTWGESHGKAIGVVVDGVPAGLPLCEDDIQVFLNRRKPGQSQFTTQRQESDTVEILSGVFEGKTTGTPISMVVWNENQKSKNQNCVKNVQKIQNLPPCLSASSTALRQKFIGKRSCRAVKGIDIV